MIDKDLHIYLIFQDMFEKLLFYCKRFLEIYFSQRCICPVTYSEMVLKRLKNTKEVKWIKLNPG